MDRTKRDGRRGQLLVVMSLMLAVMFVAMALYLNTAIFTENLATRKGDIAGAGGAASYSYAIEQGASGIMTHANYNNNSSYADLEDRFAADVFNWSDAANKLESTRARSVNVSVKRTSRGTRIVQSENRSFTNESSAENWTVADGVGGVRKFRMNVSSEQLGDSWPGNAPHEDPRFAVTFDGAAVREIQVYSNQSTDDVHVTVLDGSGSKLGTCTVTNRDHATVDVTGAKLAGQDCKPLRFFDSLGGTYDVTFANGTYAMGTYELVVNQSRATFFTRVDHHYDSPGSPFYTKALYSAELKVTYQTARIYYVRVVRIAPGESE